MLLQEYNNLEKFEVLNESEGGEKTYRLRGVFSRAGVKNKNGRIYSREIMEAAVETAQEAVKAGRFVGELDHPCLIDKNFDILTKDGWRSFESCKVGDEVVTFNENNVIEYQKIETVIDEPAKGMVYYFKGRNIDSGFTGNHKFFLEDRYGKRQVVTAKEIFDNRAKFSHSRIIKTGSWIGNKKDKVVIPALQKEEINSRFKNFNEISKDLILDAKEFFAFMGIYLSEGSISHTRDNDNRIYIHQNEGTIADEIRELLGNLGFEYKESYIKKPNSVGVTFSFLEPRLRKYLSVLGNCYNKFIPVDLKQYDSIYLEELVDWFIKGDGRDQRHYEGSNRRNIFSVSKKLIEDLHELIIKIGLSGNCTEVNDSKDYMFAGHLIEAENKSTLYQLNISTTKGIYLDERFLKIEKIEHDGNVYCITVKNNSNFYMKQNGKSFLTGNSSPKINIDKISHKITELRFTPDGAVIGEMVPAGPEKYKFISLLEDGIGVGVSTRGIGNVRQTKHMGEDILEVMQGYQMRAIDIVHDPSAGTYPEAVYESTEYDTGRIFAVSSNFKEVFDEVFSKRIK